MTFVKFIPFIALLLSLSTIITTYLVSVNNGHYNWWLPMISQTGNYPPESSIFSWGLSLTACLSIIMIYIRYLQVKQQLSAQRFQLHQDHSYFLTLNKVQFGFACVAALGLSLLATFQDINVKPVHIPAAIAFFVCAIVHISIMTRITKFITGNRHPVLHAVRIILPVLATLGLALGITFKVLDRNPAYRQMNLDAYAALNEWICVLSLGFYWLLFYFDFRHIHNFGVLVHTFAFDDERPEDDLDGVFIPIVAENHHHQNHHHHSLNHPAPVRSSSTPLLVK